MRRHEQSGRKASTACLHCVWLHLQFTQLRKHRALNPLKTTVQEHELGKATAGTAEGRAGFLRRRAGLLLPQEIISPSWKMFSARGRH